ncbi:PLP-dependent aminotransferase family protein [Pseudalkalibacillus salsuginis]|uniref:aminotransferase-like domain-containing protein n=1 Tax=Pseudalkalibacillus salsuginis TaxID=2910972 RepID=UPI001F15CF07|nr:PLP-dependent aminotransferase family protein [Pseudalkalibacillus salsuginis]MCF6410685.1 PLP-dependent aminotransferase family protein [Pseudalkalibacillus salsuginis]
MPINSFENYPMSWKPTINRKERPIYQWLARQLEADIIEGNLVPGTKLPPQRELADYLEVNLSTISKAFKVAELKGLISGTVGSGTYVSYDAVSNAYLLGEEKPKHMIEMGAMLTDRVSYGPLYDLLQEMLQESDCARWFGYGRPGDAVWQKDAGVQLLKRASVETIREQVLLANGGQNAITATLAGLCKHGDRIGVDHHTYPGIKTAAAMLGIQLVPIRSQGDEINPEALLYACKNENIKGLYLIPDYQNPMTYTMDVETRKAIAQIAIKQDLFIIENGMFHLLQDEVLPAIAVFAPEQTIYVSSLSKLMAPGLRLAYVAVPRKFLDPVRKALYNINISVSPLFAELAARAIASKGFEQIVAFHRKETKARNQLVNQYLGSENCLGGGSGIFRWLRLPNPYTGDQFEQLAAAQGVEVYSGGRFTVGNATPAKAVRLAICAPETKDELEKGLVLLKKLIDVH